MNKRICISVWIKCLSIYVSHSSCLKNSGPLHHVSHLTKLAALIPLVTQSAGFLAVGIYRHWVWTCASLEFTYPFGYEMLELSTSTPNPL